MFSRYTKIDIDHLTSVPFLRWAGSKKKILPQLAAYWKSDYRRYVEPFAGSAALFFHIGPNRAVLGDLNEQLIDLFRIVRINPDEFHSALSAVPRSRYDYYRIRAVDPDSLPAFERAVRFAYLNRLCFNGIYRTNLQGKFNVPYGGSKPNAVPPIEVFRKCALLLEQADLCAADFGRILRNTISGDFVYLDPPYAVQSRRVFRQYGPKPFNTDDLERLVGYLEGADRRGVHFLLSYADCAAARQAFRSWPTKRIRVRRNIAGFVGARRSAYELLVTNIH